nr:uncharacterized protein LOC109783431 [Aegilops tauschii subsp. strangulata]
MARVLAARGARHPRRHSCLEPHRRRDHAPGRNFAADFADRGLPLNILLLLTLVWPRSSTKTTQPCVYAGDGDFREEEGCSQEDGRKKQADSIRSSRCWPFMFLREHRDKEVGRSIVLAHWS